MTDTGLPTLVTKTTSTSSTSTTSTLNTTSSTTSSTSSTTSSTTSDISSSSSSTTSSISLTSSSASSSITYTATIPSTSLQNPFLVTDKFNQGTFYVIVLPIIAALFLIYLFGLLWTRVKSRKQAKSTIRLREKDLNQAHGLNHGNNSNLSIDKDHEKYFDIYPVTSQKHQHTLSGAGFATIQTDLDLISNHNINKLDRSFLKFENDNLSADYGTDLHRSTSHNTLDMFSMVPHAIEQNDILSRQSNQQHTFEINPDFVKTHQSNRLTGNEINNNTSRLNLKEPARAIKTSILPNNDNSNTTFALTGTEKGHLKRGHTYTQGHKKTRSGLILDEFINTGTLPEFDQLQIEGNTNLSMYQTQNADYRVGRSSSPVRPVSPNKSRFSSPERRPI